MKYEYYFQILETGPSPVYTLAKFETYGVFPTEVYTITNENRCNCPSPKHPCKHFALLEKWLELDDKQVYFDEATSEFVSHNIKPLKMEDVEKFLATIRE